MAQRPMVLHVRVVTGTGGGPEKTILNTPRFLVPAGYDVLCAYLHPPRDPGFQELQRRAAALGAAIEDIHDRGPCDHRVLLRLLRLCRDRNVAIWHGHDYKSDVIGLLLRPLWSMRLVTTVHGFGVLSGRMPWYNRIDRICLRWYDRVVCVSDDLKATCVASGVLANRCTVIHNAIDVEQYTRKASPDEAKQRLGIVPQRVVIGSVGRLSEEKNFEGLILAVDALLKEGLDLELMIVGEGEQRDALESLIASLGRRDRIHLLGYRSDPQSLYEAMDVFVLNSWREGLPNVLLEAMAMEVPAVATRIAGIPNVIQNDENGLLVNPGDSDALIDRLRQLANSPADRTRLAVAARRTVGQSYSFVARMEKIRSIYEEVLGSSSSCMESHAKSPVAS